MTERSTRHFWKAPQTIHGKRYDFFTVTDDRALSSDIESPPETSFLRRDPGVKRMCGQESLEEFCQRRPLEAHALLAEAAFQHHLATVYNLDEVSSAAELTSFNEQECELVDILAPSGSSLKIWRRVRE